MHLFQDALPPDADPSCLRLLPPSQEPAAYECGVDWTAMLEDTRVTLHGKAKEYLTLADVVDSPMLSCASTRMHIRSVRRLYWIQRVVVYTQTCVT